MRAWTIGACLAWLPMIGGLGCSSPKAELTGCTVDGTSVPNGAVNPDNPCQVCIAGSNPLGWSNGESGTSCGQAGDSFCFGGSCQKGCRIDVTFYAPGAANPANGCLACRPSVDPNGWSPISGAPPAGTCPPTGVCYLGHCQPGCTIGMTQVPAGAPNPANSCQSCQPGQTASGWTDKPPGALCADGGAICLSGNCVAGCEIGGVFYKPGWQSPSNVCQTCQPGLSVTSFSPSTGLAPGGTCGNGSYCYRGECSAGCTIGGASYAPGDPDPQGICLGCVPERSATTWSTLPPGAPCGDGGGVCSGGACLFGCEIGGVLYAPNATDPVQSCQSCQPASNPSDWSPLTSLSSACASGDVCFDGGCAPGCFINRTYYPSGAPKPGDTSQCCGPSSDTSVWSPVFVQGPTSIAPPALVNYSTPGIIAMDINRDGLPDVVTLTPTGSVGVYLNQGQGTFGPPTGYNPSPLAYAAGASLAAGDLDGDGTPDLVVGLTDGTVAVLRGLGDGEFLPIQSYRSNALRGSPPDAGPGVYGGYSYYGSYGYYYTVSQYGGQGISIADVNGDNVPDVLLAGGTMSPSFSVLAGIGDGGLRPGVPFDAGFCSTYQAIAVNVTGGASSEVFLRGDTQFHFYRPAGTGTYYYYTSDPGALSAPGHDGGWDAPSPVADSCGDLLLADLNRDGIPDLAMLNAAGSEVITMAGIGDGGFEAPQSHLALSVTGYPPQLISADFNGDGYPDLLALTFYSGTLLLNQGDGTFLSGQPLAGPGYVPAAAADFDGDGRADLAVMNADGTWTLWLNNCR